MTEARDILVIGGGIWGAAIAWALARRGLGHRVLLLERGQPAGGATSRAAALVTLARDDPSLMAMAKETFQAMAVLEAEYGEHIGRHHVGALHVGSASHAQALQARARQCASFGITSQWLDKSQALARAPWLAPGSFAFAAFYPEECFVDPYLLCSAYLRTAQQMGVQLRLGSDVQRINVQHGAVSGVSLTDGTQLTARVVINAAGAWANLLSTDLGLPLPMAPVRSQYWITEPARPSNYTPDGQLIIGTSRAIGGLIVATGCNGSGITFSGGVGRFVAELVCGVPTFVAPAVFDPQRLGDVDPYAVDFLASCAAARAMKSSG